jgi:hypothetical protein
MKLFQNGVEVGRLAKTGNIATSSAVDVWIGANPDNTRIFDGLIDEVRISSIAVEPTTPPIVIGVITVSNGVSFLLKTVIFCHLEPILNKLQP